MDLKHFDNLAALAADHRKQLETRMRKAKAVRTNLTRMVEEHLRSINERAEQDKECVAELFMQLIANAEQEIAQLREELGVEKAIMREEAKAEVTQNVILPDITPVTKLVNDKRKPSNNRRPHVI